MLGPLDEGLAAAAAAELGLCNTSTAAAADDTVWYMLNSCGSTTADASSAIEIVSVAAADDDRVVKFLVVDANVVVVVVIGVVLVDAGLPFLALEALVIPGFSPAENFRLITIQRVEKSASPSGRRHSVWRWSGNTTMASIVNG